MGVVTSQTICMLRVTCRCRNALYEAEVPPPIRTKHKVCIAKHFAVIGSHSFL